MNISLAITMLLLGSCETTKQQLERVLGVFKVKNMILYFFLSVVLTSKITG